MGSFRSFRVLRRYQMACHRMRAFHIWAALRFVPDERFIGRRKEPRANLVVDLRTGFFLKQNGRPQIHIVV